MLKTQLLLQKEIENLI